MANITVMTINETMVDAVPGDIEFAQSALVGASKGLRKCFIHASPNNPEFIAIRNDVVDMAFVFKDALLPMSTLVIQQMFDFFNLYLVMTDFEQWKQHALKEVVTDAEELAKACGVITEGYTLLATNFKEKEDACERAIQSCNLDVQSATAKAKKLSKQAEKCAVVSTVVRVVSSGITDLGFGDKSDQNADQAVAQKQEAIFAQNAARVLKDEMQPAIHGFVTAMTAIAGFFYALHLDTQSFSDKSDEALNQENKKFIHFVLLQKKAKDIQGACKAWMKAVPDFDSDLRSLPKPATNNYVQQWLNKKVSDQKEKKEISMADRFKSLKGLSSKYLALTDALNTSAGSATQIADGNEPASMR